MQKISAFYRTINSLLADGKGDATIEHPEHRRVQRIVCVLGRWYDSESTVCEKQVSCCVVVG